MTGVCFNASGDIKCTIKLKQHNNINEDSDYFITNLTCNGGDVPNGTSCLCCTSVKYDIKKNTKRKLVVQKTELEKTLEKNNKKLTINKDIHKNNLFLFWHANSLHTFQIYD